MAELREVSLVDADEEHAEAAAENNKRELTLDEIIEEYVGSLGRAQLLHVFLLSVVRIFDAQHLLVTVFSDRQPSWSCKAYASSSSSSTCSSSSSLCSLRRWEWEWDAGNKTSTIAEWDLICERRFMAGIPATLFFIGSLIGSVVQGWLADNYLGRKKIIILSCLLISLTAFLTSFSPNLWVYAALRFANGFSRSGINISCLVLSTESVGRSCRAHVSQFGYLLLILGSLSVPPIAYFSRHSWRLLYRLISLPPLIHCLFLLTPFVAESPRWLAVRRHHHHALQILSRFAKFNGRNIPDNISFSTIIITSDGPRRPLWSCGWALRRMLKIMVAGFGIGLLSYGLQLNLSNLHFNIYLSVTVNALVEIPGVFLGSLLLSLISRRVVFSSLAFTAAASCLICALFGAKKEGTVIRWPVMMVEAIGFMTGSLAFAVILVFCVEMFPTNVRNSAMSMLRVALLLGGVVAPVLVVAGRVSPALPFIVFGGFGMLSSLVTIWLPETRNAPLFETLEEQNQKEKLQPRSAVGAGELQG